MDEISHEPCPYRIVNEIGGAFAIGTVGGAVFQTFNGFRNSPAGVKNRLISSLNSLKIRTPRTAGAFAGWGAAYSMSDCSLAFIRKKEDPLNSILSGAISGAVLVSRRGITAMVSNAIVGGMIMALLEGAGLVQTWRDAKYFATRSVVENQYENE